MQNGNNKKPKEKVDLLYEVFYPIPGNTDIFFCFFIGSPSETLINPLDHKVLSVFFVQVKDKIIPLRDFLVKKVDMDYFLQMASQRIENFHTYVFDDFFGEKISAMDVKRLLYLYDVVKDKAIAKYNEYISLFIDIDSEDDLGLQTPFANNIGEFIEPADFSKITAVISNAGQLPNNSESKIIFINNKKE